MYKHFYQNIDGWFTYPDLYNKFVERMSDGGNIAEIGVWKGRSVCYLGVTVKNSGKNIKVYAVDTWQKMEIEKYHKDEDFENDAMYTSFLENISPISDIVIPKRGTSLDICKEFSDQYFDVVFIDACHDYISVKQDILSWLPKVKKEGVIAGHDYGYPSVRKAVHEIFEKEYEIHVQEDCWCIYISNPLHPRT